MQVGNDVERLRLAVKEWVSDRPPPHVMDILSAGKDESSDEAEGETELPDPRMQQKASQVLQKIRDQGLKDYDKRRQEYSLTRQPTPPPPNLKLRAPARKHHLSPADPTSPASANPIQEAPFDESPVAETQVEPPNEVVQPVASGAKKPKVQQQPAFNLMQPSSDRHSAAVPKQMLRRELFTTEAKIVHFKCGGGVETAQRHQAPGTSTPPPAQELTVTAKQQPQYNGTYTPTDEPYVWHCGACRLYRVKSRWRIESSLYTWLEAAHKHEGRNPTQCLKWDRWCPDAQDWQYEPCVSAVHPNNDRSVIVLSGTATEYDGEYTLIQLGSGLPAVPGATTLGAVLDGRGGGGGDVQNCVWSDGSRIIRSVDGYWRVYDVGYSYLETSRPSAKGVLPGRRAEWDHWDGVQIRWAKSQVTVDQHRSAFGVLPHPAIETKEVLTPRTPATPAFITNPTGKNPDNETKSLFDQLPPIQIPSLTVLDVLSGAAISKTAVPPPANGSDEPEDRYEEAREMETLTFGFHSHMKLNDAQRVLGLTYRFSANESKLAPVPNDHASFAHAYGREKSTFNKRCMREIKRMAAQRKTLYPKKRRILNDILRVQTQNSRWRNASYTLQKRMFADVEREFKATRQSLLQTWMSKLKSALPPVQAPGCAAVLNYLDELFNAPDLVLNKAAFVHLCNVVLSARHFLLDDVIRLLWPVKRVFQVTDEQFCELVRVRTKLLFDSQLILPSIHTNEGKGDDASAPTISVSALSRLHATALAHSRSPRSSLAPSPVQGA